jgi:hypothetical protein
MAQDDNIETFLKEVMDKTYALCKHDDSAVAFISQQLNGRAYRLLKKIERSEEQHSDN